MSAETGTPSGQGAQIDRHSAVPMYDQLRSMILDMIDRKQVGPGDLIPGEHRLCEQYGVSRTVVRQALAQLEIDRVVERVKGKGTFVSRPKVAESLVHTLSGLYDEVARRGGHVHSDILRHEKETASDEVARRLGIALGDTVVVLDRLRWVDDEPWSLTTTWMPEDIGELTLGVDMSEKSLYSVLAESDIIATSGTRSAEAAIATPDQAAQLQLTAGDPLLLLRSVSEGATGQPIEHFVAYHRGDRSRFEFQLHGDRSVARLHITD